VGQARSGIMYNIVGEREFDLPPMQIGGAICDQLTSIMLINGILTALIARDRLGDRARSPYIHAGQHD